MSALPSLPVKAVCSSIAKINGTLYIGGGFTEKTSKRFKVFNKIKYCSSPAVFKHVKNSRSWKEISIPPHKCIHFALASVEEKLHLIGGEFVTKQDIPPKYDKGLYSNLVMTYDTVTGKWTSDLPPLNHPRRLPSATATETHLIVAGGVDEKGNAVNSVEVLDLTVENVSWVDFTITNCSMHYPQIVVIDEVLYWGQDRADCLQYNEDIINENWDIFSIPLHELMQPKSDSTTESLSTRINYASFIKLPPPPKAGATMIAFEGNLLLVGGRYLSNRKSSWQCYTFNLSGTFSWQPVCDLPQSVLQCFSSCIIPTVVYQDGTLYFGGGFLYNKIYSQLERGLTVITWIWFIMYLLFQTTLNY